MVITDLDIKRRSDSNNHLNLENITSLQGKKTTNHVLIKYLKINVKEKKLPDTLSYYENQNLKIVFQKDPIDSYYASSLEEAYILQNYQHHTLMKTIKGIAPDKHKEWISKDNETIKKESSYKIQKFINDNNKKSDFSNFLIYNMSTQDKNESTPKLPKYINEGLEWLMKKLQISNIEDKKNKKEKSVLAKQTDAVGAL